MKTTDVKVGGSYLYKNNIVTVFKRIRGKETTKRIMHGGILFTGYVRKQKKFELSSGEIVFAKELIKI